MTFSPILPSSGLTGWLFLQRTASAQQEAMSQSQSVKRLTDTFRDRVGDIQTAEAFVADRELLSVALTAFGLEDDINNKFYIQKVLEENTADPDALANRLADKRYLEMAQEFGFGDVIGPRTNRIGFADGIVSKYETKHFEAKIGEIDPDMRLALSLNSNLEGIGSKTTSNDTKWFSIMGNPPLRRVFETAFGLPSAFGAQPIDKQLEVLKDKAQSLLKTDQISDFQDPETLEKLTNTFLLRSQLASSNSFGSGTIALSLLQSAPQLYPN